ncbi:MAG: Asp-tRNA(Asn)/Glu-tRNA(Gln) amidotransferase GatCAB subunit B, partial [Elusimicrobia bacterium]|nr:Asp-tRNA(Asn)/Glu-tRNA(Gln) amidotransferase GatCAB subunit B [Elusimicrobiota bacterium]
AQETRLWDADLRQTRSMRSKEEAHDYRYFPEPDLPPLAISAKWVEEVRAELPELPQARRRRLREEHGLSAYDIGVLTAQRALADYFERGMRSQTPPPSAKLLSNWITTELLGRLNAANLDVAQSPVSTENLAALTALIEKGSISGKMAKEVFGRMWSTGRAAGDIVAEAGLSQVSDDGLLRQWIETAIRENEKAAADVRGGKTRAVAAIVGAVMQKSRGKANPAKVNQLILELLK